MYYVLLVGPDIGDKDFEERDRLRDLVVESLKLEGILFVEYHWVWDETNKIQLLLGQYQNLSDAKEWIGFFVKKGFDLRIVEKIP